MVIQLTVFVIRPLVRMTICTRNFRITCKCLEKRIERTKHRWLASDNARVSLNPPHCDRELRVSTPDRADCHSSGQACQVLGYGRSEAAMYRAYGVRQVPSRGTTHVKHTRQGQAPKFGMLSTFVHPSVEKRHDGIVV